MNQRNWPKRNRRGFTMIEVLAGMTLLSLILSVNAVWIYKTMKFSARVDQRHEDHLNMTRLAGDFRDDIRSSHTMSLVNASKLKLDFPTDDDSTAPNASSATYTIAGNEVLVVKEIVGSKLAKRERFKFSENVSVRWGESELPDRIALLVLRDPNMSSDRKSKADQTVDSLGSIPSTTTPPDEMITLMHLWVSPNRWVIEPREPKSDPEPDVDTDVEDDFEEKQSQPQPKSDQEQEVEDAKK